MNTILNPNSQKRRKEKLSLEEMNKVKALLVTASRPELALFIYDPDAYHFAKANTTERTN